jgi:transcriptional regulator with XRE-family HTH domain
MPINESIRAERKKHGMTMLVLANKIDASVVAVCNWENGKRNPTARNRVKLARAFGLDPATWISELAE